MLTIDKIEKIPPADVTIPDRLRHMNEDRVLDMMESFTRMGQMTPIQTRIVGDGDDVILIAGRHRLEAAIRLGWQYINMTFVDGTADEFRLWEIAENLHRSELTALERAEHITEWVKLTKKTTQEQQERVLSQVETKPQGGRPEGGDRAASRVLGLDKNKVSRAAKVDAISPEAKQAAREAGIDTKQSALLKIAAAPKDEQVEVAMALGVARSTRKKADEGEEAVAAFVAFVSDNLFGSAIRELADRLETGPVKKFIVALRGMA